jgi:hypothetical protein
MMGLPQPNNPMLLSVETPRPPRPTLPVNGQRRPDLVAPEHLLPGSKSAEPLGCVRILDIPRSPYQQEHS